MNVSEIIDSKIYSSHIQVRNLKAQYISFIAALQPTNRLTTGWCVLASIRERPTTNEYREFSVFIATTWAVSAYDLCIKLSTPVVKLSKIKKFWFSSFYSLKRTNNKLNRISHSWDNVILLKQQQNLFYKCDNNLKFNILAGHQSRIDCYIKLSLRSDEWFYYCLDLKLNFGKNERKLALLL